MPATTSWAERIQQAKNETVKFAPLELGEHNFTVSEATVKTAQSSGNSYISIQAKVLDGPQANARVFHSVFPESPKAIPMFLRFYEALGLTTQWLEESNPSLDEIASSFKGRNFSAEAYVADDAQVDSYTGEPRRSIRNFKPQGAAVPAQGEPPTPQGTPDTTGFGKTAPNPSYNANQGFGQSAPTSTEASSPWNTSSTSAPPF